MNRAQLLASVTVTAALALHCGRNPSGESIHLSGNIETTQVDLGFKVAGRILERPVDEGQMVQAGQLVARLDARDLAQQASAQQAAEATAFAQLTELRAGSRKEEIESAKAAVDQAEADLKRLEPDEARARDLQRRGILSVRDYEATQASFMAAKGKVNQARQAYILAKKGPRAEEIAQSQARHEQAKQLAALARTQLDFATLNAPMAGVVLSKNAEPGEYIAPGASVVTLADLQHVWVRAYIEETELGRVKLGQRALVNVDTFPGRSFEGRVSFISDQAEFTPKSVQTRKERVKLVYRIKIDVANPSLELKPGMPADARIMLVDRR